ncbi:unnamed protein product [Spodoptera littoralis]|uniref:Uncharacterized protein n=1 Tax=Spodoptera littoralis TaxID=7109 RepID=A0A9P0IAT4_SPOLI|nr:unnamed protein product [Spodoptera littoralis]CAH1643288.1 unnamed protein product [Spodoptera littoralis]
MSSTSSSDCENCDCSQCTYLLEDKRNSCMFYHGKSKVTSRRGPTFTTMAHPLVYYAELPRSQNRCKTCVPKKENCFVKAFKWYTQERIPERYDFNPEVTSFADWLDNKYIEYLCENRQNQCYELKIQKTTTVEEIVPCAIRDPCTRKFSRIKSPWKKRRHPCNNADFPEKGHNQSCEFILQPKDLTRAVSENCYQTPSSNVRSNATVASSNIPCSARSSGRSQSLSSVCERSVQKPIDTIPQAAQEGPKTQGTCELCQQDQTQQVPSKSRAVCAACQFPEEIVIPVNVEVQCEPAKQEQQAPTCCNVDTGNAPISRQASKVSNVQIILSVEKVPFKKQKREKKLQICCQCPEENVEKVDTKPQYQSTQCTCCVNEVAPKRESQEVNQIFGPKSIRRQSQSTVTVVDGKCDCTVKEVAIVSKVTCVTEDAAQTSDHSICFDKGVADYPLFMKIICADKLNTECTRTTC